MKFLLLNDNPVVNKLVTLSAQKTGDELVAAEGAEEIEAADYDLLIIDHAVYNTALLDAIREKITYRRALFIAPRGEEVPEGFDKVINKPFLPTDLVEFFSEQIIEANDETRLDLDNIESEQGDISSSTEEEVLPELAEEELIEELDLDLPEDMFETEEENVEEEGVEDLFDEKLLSDIEEDLSLDDLAGFDEQEGGILDEDELHEVQELLDDTDSTETDGLQTEEKVVGLKQESMDEVNDALADLDEKLGEDEGLDIDDEFLDDLLMEDDENEPAVTVDQQADQVEFDEPIGEIEPLSANKSDTAEEADMTAAPEEELPVNDLEELNDELSSELPSSEEPSQTISDVENVSSAVSIDEILSDDLEELHDELSEFPEELPQKTAASESESSAISSEEPHQFGTSDEAISLDEESPGAEAEAEIDMGDMANLEEEIENAVSTLSEEDLAQDIDEALLLDIVSSDTESEAEEMAASDGFEELDTLNERDLKIALGEAEESSMAEEAGASDAADEVATTLLQEDDRSADDDYEITASGAHDGLDALYALTKTLKKVLKDESAAAALQGMKINVNITFGDEN